MKYLLRVTSIFLLLLGCGRPGEEKNVPRSTWGDMLSQGRLHRYFLQKPANSLNLTEAHEEIVQWHQLADSPYAAWFQFDTRLMPDIEEAQIHEQLDFVKKRYGSMLADLNEAEWIPAPRFIRRDESRLFLNYTRIVHKLPVRDNILQLVLVEMEPGLYRLAEIQSNISGPAPSVPATVPKIAEVDWLEDLTGRTDYQLTLSYEEWIPFLEQERFHWRTATVFEWVMDGQHYRATLLADEGAWLDAFPLAVHAKPIVSKALKRSYAEDGPREYPLAFSASAGSDGLIVLGAEAWLPNGFEPASVALNGPRAMVFDAQSNNELSYTGLQEKEASFFLPDDPSRLAAVNAFVAVQRINRFARQFLSSQDAPFLDQALVVNVNLVEQSCNAFYSPKQQRLLLYKEGNNCANMALLNDVIYHEWGHALDDHVGRSPGITDPAFSEGIADTTAAFFNDDPAIAPYFIFDDPEPIRLLTNQRNYPRDIGQMHYEGGIIASTFWDLRQAMIDRYGANRGAHLAGRLFFRHLLAVDSYLESYAAVLRIDDDDRNPATPSPNHCLINSIFAKHGLASSEACEDMPMPLVGVSSDLTAALLDAGPEENAVHVLASARNAERLALCLGSRATCLENSSTWITLQKVGSQPERSFFRSVSPILLPPLSLMNIFRLDVAGQVLESRELKIFAK